MRLSIAAKVDESIGQTQTKEAISGSVDKADQVSLQYTVEWR